MKEIRTGEETGQTIKTMGAIVTLRDLKSSLPSTSGKRLPTAKQLRNTDQLILSRSLYEGSLCVFASGFAIYRSDKHTAVLRVDRISTYTYEYATTDKSISLDDQPWTTALTLAAEKRMETFQDDRISRRCVGFVDDYNDEDSEGRESSDAKVLAGADDVEQIVTDKLEDRIERMLGCLTERQRQIFTMYHIDGLRQQEIANKLGIARRVVGHTLEAAITRIQKSFNISKKRVPNALSPAYRVKGNKNNPALQASSPSLSTRSAKSRERKGSMSKHNNNSTFRTNNHQFPQKGNRRRSDFGQYECDHELLRAIFCKESTVNDLLTVLDRIANQGSKTVKELRSMRESFADFRDDLTSIAALMTCAVLAIGNEKEQKALRDYLDDNETPNDQENQDTSTPGSDDQSKPEPEKPKTDTAKYALRTEFDMNAIMRAAIDATEEDPATVRKITEAIVACLKRRMETHSFTTKRFMGELDKAVRKRAAGDSDPTDFDAAIALVKNTLPVIDAAVADATGFDRTVVDRIAFSELLAAKKMLINTSCVASGSEAQQMIDSLQKADLRGTNVGRDANGVEVQ